MNPGGNVWPRLSQVLAAAVPFCLLAAVCAPLPAQNYLRQPGPESSVAGNFLRQPAAIVENTSGGVINSVRPVLQIPAFPLPEPGTCLLDGDSGQELAFKTSDSVAEPSETSAAMQSTQGNACMWDGLAIRPAASSNCCQPLVYQLRPAINFAAASAQPTTPAPAVRSPEQLSRPKCLEERPVSELTTNIAIKPEPEAGTGPSAPESIAGSCLEPAIQGTGQRAWASQCYCWEAPALCHGPLYFEETNLERYGYSQNCLRTVQPLVSSAHFFGTTVMLPYLMVAEPERECVYTLGEYRPGSCVPFQWNYPYFSPALPWQKCD